MTTGNVVDLMSRRTARGQQALHFDSAVEALAYATTQIRDLERLASGSLLIAACELELPLAQAASILAAVTRLHEELPRQGTTS